MKLYSTNNLHFRLRSHNLYTFLTMKPDYKMRRVLQCSAMLLIETSVARYGKVEFLVLSKGILF